MTQATRDIIKTALSADPTISQEERAEIVRSLGDAGTPRVRLYSQREAARILGVSVSTVARMKREGTLQARRVRSQRKITATSIEAVYSKTA